MSEAFWINWLKAASAILVIMGVMSFAASHPATAGLWHGVYGLVVTPEGGTLAPFSQAGHFSNALLGGILIGWGVMLWIAVSEGLANGHMWIKSMIRVSAICWFVPDSLGSVLAGAPLNVIGNILFLAAFLYPLAQIGKAGSSQAQTA